MASFYYIHGFNSGFNPESEKCKTLAKLGKVYGRTTDYLDPNDVIGLLFDIQQKASEVDGELILVGTSLGGYFARLAAKTHNLRCILINPSLEPAATLSKAVGWPMKNYVTGGATLVTEEGVKTLAGYDVDKTPDCLAILAIDDEVIDYRVAQAKLAATCKITLTEGGHRLEDVNKLLDTIELFVNTLPANGL